MQALLTFGRSRICCTPALDFWVKAGCKRDAIMKLGWPSGSLGSGGMRTKCRISAAEVPMYRFSSRVSSQRDGGRWWAGDGLQNSTQVMRTSWSWPSAESGMSESTLRKV